MRFIFLLYSAFMRQTDDGPLFGDSRNRETRHSNAAIDSRAMQPHLALSTIVYGATAT